ncbi:MAG TPA: hypothetical protein VFJ16_27045, partial [Longimicrobium sp.]|nr:hypothetical protein [Longimicrobium sp.]
ETTRHMVVLADSGMGKSALLSNYYARNLKRSALRRHKIAIVHLGLPDADERIRQIKKPEATALFLDAFDEDTRAVVDHRARIGELLQLASKFRRLLITSRTQFFPADEEIPQSTGLLKTGARGTESATYEFRKLYLAPFRDSMVRKYLRKRFPGLRRVARRKAWKLVQKVPLMSVRPMLLTHIPDLIDSQRSLQTTYEIYDELVKAWYRRESHWVDPALLDSFSIHLAVDLFIHREVRNAEQIAYAELRPLAQKWGIALDEWQLRGRSLLNRDAVGNYKFAHRSIMEFLVTKALSDANADPGDVQFRLVKTYLVENALRQMDFSGPVVIPTTFEGLTNHTARFLTDGFDLDRINAMVDECSGDLILMAHEKAFEYTQALIANLPPAPEHRLVGPPVYVILGSYYEDVTLLGDVTSNLLWFLAPSMQGTMPSELDECQVTDINHGPWRRPSSHDKLIASDSARAILKDRIRSGIILLSDELKEVESQVTESEVLESLLRHVPPAVRRDHGALMMFVSDLIPSSDADEDAKSFPAPT